jgi:peptidoglycan hydrolase CwlO-like protein
VPRAAAASACVALALLGSGLTAASSGDIQGQIASKQSTADSLKAAIASDTAAINATSTGLQNAQRRLSGLQADLNKREAELRSVQSQLLAARAHLLELENRLQQAARALSSNLVAEYEGSRPDFVSVVLEAKGFNDVLEGISFLRRVGQQDAQIVGDTRTARAAVARQANALAALEARDRALADQVLSQRNQVAALQMVLAAKQAQQQGARASKTAQLGAVDSQLKKLEAKAAQEARAATVGGIATSPGGMVQAPAGAPAAVRQVIAAGNAIASLPYVWGGGHGSFHDSGYDCSGSVSYALAAGGLLSSPLDSTGFESWGAPGPGQWITVYANSGHAFMVVAGWRFDTGALSSGTRWSQSMADTSGFVARHPPGL